jgi:hypothetical protein
MRTAGEAQARRARRRTIAHTADDSAWHVQGWSEEAA